MEEGEGKEGVIIVQLLHRRQLSQCWHGLLVLD